VSTDTDPTVSRSTEIAAPAEQVWSLVSDLPGMGRFSPESTGGSWSRGSGPEVGAVFRGRNAQGRRRWSTRSTVVEAEPGRCFSFDVSSVGLAVARWRYDLAPTSEGCRLTETWVDRRGRLMRLLGTAVSGVQDRQAYAATSIEHTLQEVKAAAEKADVS
jgi:hypothetical protein